MDPDTKKLVEGIWKYSDRILLVTLSGKAFDIAILQVYAPTLEYQDEDIELFYECTDEVLYQLKSQDIKIVMGDLNSKVGEGGIDNTVGPYGSGAARTFYWRGDFIFISFHFLIL